LYLPSGVCVVPPETNFLAYELRHKAKINPAIKMILFMAFLFKLVIILS
jgi:hypothetical protein